MNSALLIRGGGATEAAFTFPNPAPSQAEWANRGGRGWLLLAAAFWEVGRPSAGGSRKCRRGLSEEKRRYQAEDASLRGSLRALLRPVGNRLDGERGPAFEWQLDGERDVGNLNVQVEHDLVEELSKGILVDFLVLAQLVLERVGGLGPRW